MQVFGNTQAETECGILPQALELGGIPDSHLPRGELKTRNAPNMNMFGAFLPHAPKCDTLEHVMSHLNVTLYSVTFKCRLAHFKKKILSKK